MKIAITGGRDYQVTDDDVIWCAVILKDLEPDPTKLVILHGDAPGVDRYMADVILDSLGPEGARVMAYPADWKAHGKAAGPIRNRQMAQACDCLLAFPGGKGTEDMVSAVKALGKPVYESPSRQPV